MSRPQNEQAWYRSSALAKLRRSAATNIARQRLLPRYIMAWSSGLAATLPDGGDAPHGDYGSRHRALTEVMARSPSVKPMRTAQSRAAVVRERCVSPMPACRSWAA